MKPALLDTDTISYFLKGKGNAPAQMQAYLNQYATINLSVISFYEIMNGLIYLNAHSQLKGFQKLLTLANIIPQNDGIALRGAEIYAELRKNRLEISHTDVLIAATALVHGLTLVTNNTGHFARVDHLVLENRL